MSSICPCPKPPDDLPVRRARMQRQTVHSGRDARSARHSAPARRDFRRRGWASRLDPPRFRTTGRSRERCSVKWSTGPDPKEPAYLCMLPPRCIETTGESRDGETRQTAGHDDPDATTCGVPAAAETRAEPHGAGRDHFPTRRARWKDAAIPGRRNPRAGFAVCRAAACDLHRLVCPRTRVHLRAPGKRV